MHKAYQVWLCAIVICTLMLYATVYNGQLISPGSSLLKVSGQNPGVEEQDAKSEHHDEGESNSWKFLYPTSERSFSRALVLASTHDESTTWIEEELSDILEPNGPISSAVYVTDDVDATLHTPLNKGHEANVYFTYIIQHYDTLPDVVLFMHAHRTAWHNNDLLDHDAALAVRNLSPLKVIEDGYANLRCQWDPGCPDWIHTDRQEKDDFKQEEAIIATAFRDIFPNDEVPEILAQPCCGQFAVSAEKIRSLPKERYKELRDWIYSSELDDYLTGRVFEYLWQYLFSGLPTACPTPNTCYCELYGVCFDSDNDYDEWKEAHNKINQINDDLDDWHEKEEFHREHCLPKVLEDTQTGVENQRPAAKQLHDSLRKSVEQLEKENEKRVRRAYANGRKRRGL